MGGNGFKWEGEYQYSHPTNPPQERRDEPSPSMKSKTPVNRLGFSVGDNGLEPSTFAMSTQRSNQLS